VRAECTLGEKKGGGRPVVYQFLWGCGGFQVGFLSGLRIWLFACERGWEFGRDVLDGWRLVLYASGTRFSTEREAIWEWMLMEWLAME